MTLAADDRGPTSGITAVSANVYATARSPGDKRAETSLTATRRTVAGGHARAHTDTAKCDSSGKPPRRTAQPEPGLEVRVDR